MSSAPTPGSPSHAACLAPAPHRLQHLRDLSITGGGGIITPRGDLLGTIMTPETATNRPGQGSTASPSK